MPWPFLRPLGRFRTWRRCCRDERPRPSGFATGEGERRDRGGPRGGERRSRPRPRESRGPRNELRGDEEGRGRAGLPGGEPLCLSLCVPTEITRSFINRIPTYNRARTPTRAPPFFTHTHPLSALEKVRAAGGRPLQRGAEPDTCQAEPSRGGGSRTRRLPDGRRPALHRGGGRRLHPRRAADPVQ